MLFFFFLFYLCWMYFEILFVWVGCMSGIEFIVVGVGLGGCVVVVWLWEVGWWVYLFEVGGFDIYFYI